MSWNMMMLAMRTKSAFIGSPITAKYSETGT